MKGRGYFAVVILNVGQHYLKQVNMDFSKGRYIVLDRYNTAHIGRYNASQLCMYEVYVESIITI